MADLPLDQSRALGAVMLQLHRSFRQRHGLPPLPTAWTLLEDLAAVTRRASLTDRAAFRSPAPVIGAPLTALRRAVWMILKPIFYRQTEVNRDVLLALEALARDREANQHATRVLSERVSELEAAVARLRARVE